VEAGNISSPARNKISTGKKCSARKRWHSFLFGQWRGKVSAKKIRKFTGKLERAKLWTWSNFYRFELIYIFQGGAKVATILVPSSVRHPGCGQRWEENSGNGSLEVIFGVDLDQDARLGMLFWNKINFTSVLITRNMWRISLFLLL